MACVDKSFDDPTAQNQPWQGGMDGNASRAAISTMKSADRE
ncbi:MAG: hypothetical protein ABI162_12435 [Luteolibacter sp.]